ncbi:unnamed protein product, partial [Effrenium voratum]
EYRERVAENEGAGVVVSSQAGGNALVLLNHLPDQPELLPVVSDTFRAQQVKIVRGWLESGTDAFEVSDWKGQPLSSQRGISDVLFWQFAVFDAEELQTWSKPCCRQYESELRSRTEEEIAA